RTVNHDAFDRLVQFQVLAQRRVLERLKLVIHRRLAVVGAAGDVFQENIDFFVGDDVSDILRVPAELAEGNADHFVAGYRRPSAIARVDRGVDLDAQTRYRKVVGHELDPRNDSLGDGQRRPSRGKAVRQHRILDLRQLTGAHHCRMGVEKGRIVELQNGQVDAGGDRHHRGGQLVAGRIGLDLHLSRVQNHVGIGQYALAFDHHARSGYL